MSKTEPGNPPGNTRPSPRAAIARGLAALAGAAAGTYAALTARPMFFLIPIRDDSILNDPPADLSGFQQVGLSFLRGLVLVTHYSLWIVGSAVLAIMTVALLRGLAESDGAGRLG